MTGGRVTGAAPGPVSGALSGLVSSGRLKPDPRQADAAAVLDRIARELGERPRLFQKPRPVRGAYLVGRVGRGKTMLMDLFFSTGPDVPKRRVHFHEFMNDMHEAIAAFRTGGKGRNADPVAAVTADIVRGTRLLCLDEFQVEDITNAMLLGRLFGQLFEGGVTIVATSNTVPDDLYRNGLNRQLVLPFIAELKARTELVPLDGPDDYRRLKFAGEQVFHFGTGAETAREMDAQWLRLTGGDPGRPDSVTSLGRQIAVPRTAFGAARFNFAYLCDVPLGARDYLKLAHSFDALMIDGVPRFTAANGSAGKRFVLLVDTLYDRGMRLLASFAAPLDQLCENRDLAAEFARTTSRLVEMQSADWLDRTRSG